MSDGYDEYQRELAKKYKTREEYWKYIYEDARQYARNWYGSKDMSWAAKKVADDYCKEYYDK